MAEVVFRTEDYVGVMRSDLPATQAKKRPGRLFFSHRPLSRPGLDSPRPQR